jgi:hypothetical protein
MIGDIVGFATIRINATTGKGTKELDSFLGKDCRVLEFAKDGGVLVVNNKATSLCMFDKEDIYRSFKCSMLDGVVCPPNLNFIEQTLHYHKCTNRKGGYPPILMHMVIEASLAKGEYHDSFLWQKQ